MEGARTSVLIAGAGAVGTACAVRFASLGARLALADVDPAALARAAGTLGEHLIARALVDLREERAVAELSRLAGELPGIDVAVFAAGPPWCGDLLSEDPAVFLDLLRSSVVGLSRFVRAVTPGLRERRGLLAIVSGADARAPGRFVELWGVGSACEQALGRAVAAELAGRGVRVVNVAVHGVAGGGLDEVTHLLAEALGDEDAAARALGSRRTAAPPTADDVARTIAALASAPLHGGTIALDGGATGTLA